MMFKKFIYAMVIVGSASLLACDKEANHRVTIDIDALPQVQYEAAINEIDEIFSNQRYLLEFNQALSNSESEIINPTTQLSYVGMNEFAFSRTNQVGNISKVGLTPVIRRNGLNERLVDYIVIEFEPLSTGWMSPEVQVEKIIIYSGLFGEFAPSVRLDVRLSTQRYELKGRYVVSQLKNLFDELNDRLHYFAAGEAKS